MCFWVGSRVGDEAFLKGWGKSFISSNSDFGSINILLFWIILLLFFFVFLYVSNHPLIFIFIFILFISITINIYYIDDSKSKIVFLALKLINFKTNDFSFLCLFAAVHEKKERKK